MELKIEYVDPYSLNPYEHNVKKHGDKQIKQIKKSIQDFGMNDPIGIWKDNLVIEGHGRLQACLELGLTEVPVVRLDHLTDEQRKAYCLVHNKLTMNTGFDNELLGFELATIDMDLSDFGLELPEFKFESEESTDAQMRTVDSYNLPEVDLSRVAGKYGMPIIEPTNHIPTQLVGFNYVLNSHQYEKGVHFYLDDYQFERVWNRPYEYLPKLMPYDCVLTPNFSLYLEMPLVMQMWNTYRNKLIGQMCQDMGMTVIPALAWAREDSWEFAFDGLSKGGTVCVSTLSMKRDEECKDIWLKGMDEAIRRLEPDNIIIYGGEIDYKYPKGTNVSYISNTNTEKWSK